MVNAPPSSWEQHAYSRSNTHGDENEDNMESSKVNVYSTSTTVEVEAAAALMSLPTFGVASISSKRTFSTLAQQQGQQDMVYEAMDEPSHWYTSQASTSQTYHGRVHQSQAEHDPHQSASAPRFQLADEATSHGSYTFGSRRSSYGSTSDSSSHAAASANSVPRFQFGDQEQQVLQSSYSYRRKASFCSSSDSSVGSGSYHHGEAAMAPPSASAPRFQFADETSSKSRRLDQHLGSYRRSKSYNSDSSSVSSADSSSFHETSLNDPWFPGAISLALDEDEEVLSPLHCFMRKHCVEAFSATAEDVVTPRYGKSHGGKIVVGQVGIRCCHCKSRPVQHRPDRAVCFPSSLKNIYHSIETWQRRHSGLCTDMPPAIKQELSRLMENSRSTAGGRRQYWQDAAKRLGLVDTICGVRFARPPGLAFDDSNSSLNAASRESSSSILSSLQDMTTTSSPFISQPLITEEDRPLVTEYLFLLMSQMESCRFTEEDRTGGRSKIKAQEVGFPGMQCRHCRGKAGFGRYFPQSPQALALANSDRNICNHVLKCRKCPNDTKEMLLLLQDQQQGASGTTKKNKRGSRKQFFERVWERLHGPSQEPRDTSTLASEDNQNASTTSLSSAASSLVAATAQSLANTWLMSDS